MLTYINGIIFHITLLAAERCHPLLATTIYIRIFLMIFTMYMYVQLHVYNTTVVPTLLYGAETFCHVNISAFDKIQKGVLRFSWGSIN